METYKSYLEAYTKGLLGFNTLGILAQSCLGSIAAMTILMNGTRPLQIVELFFVIILSMGFNVMVLSQQSPKVIFNTLLISVCFNLLMTLINTLSF
jgi:hypothetical protein